MILHGVKSIFEVSFPLSLPALIQKSGFGPVRLSLRFPSPVQSIDPKDRRSAKSCQMPSLCTGTNGNNPWPALPPAHQEARLLFEMVGRNGPTTSREAIRNLIDVPPDIENRLRHYAQFISHQQPHEARSLLKVIAWRKEVLSQFDRLTSQQVQSPPSALPADPCASGFLPQR